MFVTLRRALSGNPLLRRLDRVEAGVTILATALALLALVYCGGLGYSFYATQTQDVAQQAATRHQVDAVALDSSSENVYPPATTITSHVQWFANSVTRDQFIRVNHPLKVGEHLGIWVNEQGGITTPPLTVVDARANAILQACAVWAAVAALFAGAIWMLRRRLENVRHDQWDRDFRLLADGGGRTTHNS